MKNLKTLFFTAYWWFEPQNYLKILENGKMYHTVELGVIPITGLGLIPIKGLGLRAQKLGFCVRIL